MKRLLIRGLISGTASLSPGALNILRAMGRIEGQQKHRLHCALHTKDASAVATPAPTVSVSTSTGGPERLVFVQVLPGRWVRCTGTMAGNSTSSGATSASTDSHR